MEDCHKKTISGTFMWEVYKNWCDLVFVWKKKEFQKYEGEAWSHHSPSGLTLFVTVLGDVIA